MSSGNQIGSKMWMRSQAGPYPPSLGKMDHVRCLTKFKSLREFVVDRLYLSAIVVAWCGGSEAISSTDLELPVSAVSSFQRVKVVRKLGDTLNKTMRFRHSRIQPQQHLFSNLANDGDQRYTYNSGNFCLCLEFLYRFIVGCSSFGIQTRNNFLVGS